MTAGGSYSMWNFPQVNQKRRGINKGDQQKSDIVQRYPFLALVFSRCVTHLYGITLAMTLSFSRISKTNLETSMEDLQRHFLDPTCFFFLEQTNDRRIDLFWVLRYPAYCTGLELLPEPPQNIKSVADYIQKCVFLLFPNNLLICNVKVLILLLPTSSATCRLFSCIFYECISIDVSEKVYVILCNLIG